MHETQFSQLVLRSSQNFIVTIESPVIETYTKEKRSSAIAINCSSLQLFWNRY